MQLDAGLLRDGSVTRVVLPVELLDASCDALLTSGALPMSDALPASHALPASAQPRA